MLDQQVIESLLASPPATLADKVRATVGKGKIPARSVATACGVSVQAVSGWRQHGRVDKKHIKVLSTLTGLRLSWWLPGFDPDEPESPWPFEPWVPYFRIASLDKKDLGYLAGRLEEALKDLILQSQRNKG